MIVLVVRTAGNKESHAPVRTNCIALIGPDQIVSFLTTFLWHHHMSRLKWTSRTVRRHCGAIVGGRVEQDCPIAHLVNECQGRKGQVPEPEPVIIQIVNVVTVYRTACDKPFVQNYVFTLKKGGVCPLSGRKIISSNREEDLQAKWWSVFFAHGRLGRYHRVQSCTQL
jgi:hypothetical protein